MGLIAPVTFLISAEIDKNSELLSKFSIAGRIEETGTYFEIKDSEHLNITLKSTAEIKVVLESIPRMISLIVEPTSKEINSTLLTIEGLEPNKIYYQYQDSYKNEIAFISNENGSYSWIQDLTQPHHIWFQEIKGTIFISESTILDQDITGSVEIIASNITLDCNGHSITGDKIGYGIYLNGKTNVVIKNCQIRDFSSGITLLNSADILVAENNINSSYYGIQATGIPSRKLKILKNKVSDNDSTGLILYGDKVHQSEIVNNEISNNGFAGLHLSGWENIIEGNNISNNGTIGLRLYNLNNSIIKNTIDFNGEYGVLLEYAWQNTFSQNNIKLNQKYGFYSWCSGANIIFLNNLINNLFNYSFGTWVGCGTPPPNIFHSSEKLNYQYNNQIFNNYLGNYWSDYLGFDFNNDGVGDISYSFGLDNYPLIQTFENYLILLPNQPPTISQLGQFKSDGIISLSEGAITTEDIVVFKAVLNDPDNDQVKLQVELKEFNQPFNEQDLLESNLVNSGNKTTITRYGLINGQYRWRARAVDSRGAVSEWQEFGEIGNVDFEVKLVPLYTQVESPYPSWEKTRTWANLDYGRGDYLSCLTETPPYRSTIARCGCAITSMVMLGRYYDIDIGIDNTNVDPGNINAWLTDNKGYTSDGSLYWAKGVEYLGFIENGIKKARLGFDYYNEPFGSFRIDNYINLAKPAIAYSGKFGHYFIVDNKLTATYGVKDPYWYNTKTLNDDEDLVNKIRDYNNYFNKANLFSYLTTPRPITGAIYLYLASPAELLITDPLGRKLGKDPINNIVYNEIPDSSYTAEGPIITSEISLIEIKEAKVIYIPTPIDGKYTFQVIGIDSGSYILETLLYDQNGEAEKIVQEGNTTVNNIQEFELDYSGETIEKVKLSRIVDIDIKPGSYPNSVNPKSKGVTPVAVLTNKFFNAKDIVVESIVFAGANPLRGKLEDIDKDEDLDLILHFDTQSLQLDPNSTEAVLTARLKNNTLIKGVDSLRVIVGYKLQNNTFLASVSSAFLNVLDINSLYEQLKIFWGKLTSIWMRILRFLESYFKQSRKETEKINQRRCLSNDEFADYLIDEKYNPRIRVPKVPLIISVKDKKTLQEKFNFQIENIEPRGPRPLIRKCGVYVIRRFNYDPQKTEQAPGYREEIWRYRYNGFGEAIFLLAEKDEKGIFKAEFGGDFQIDPNENYLVLTKWYVGHKDYALLIKNINTLEDLFLLKLKDIVEKNKDILPGSFGFGNWLEDGKYLCGDIFYGALSTAYGCIKMGVWEIQIYSTPPDFLAGVEKSMNYKKWYLAYVDIPTFTGVQEIYEQIIEKAKKEGKQKNLFVYNLQTKEKIKIASADPSWRFNIKWLSETELEYYLPSGERKIYKISE